MTETGHREDIARLAGSLFARGLTSGSSGNISVRLEDGWLMTPTGLSLGDIEPSRISKLATDGTHQSGDKPTKETFLHMAMYAARPKTRAVVHLHSSYAVAVSCLSDVDRQSAIPPLTAYFAMRVGTLPIIPYAPPGDPALGDAVRAFAKDHRAVLLANHGPVVAGATLQDAVHTSEELEEAAKLFLLLRGQNTNSLTSAEVADLQARYPVEC